MIPKKIQLNARTIRVLVDEVLFQKTQEEGIALFPQNQIVISKDPVILESSMEEAFCHELTHWILYMMNNMKLCTNEQFVTVFANLLYQALKSGGIWK